MLVLSFLVWATIRQGPFLTLSDQDRVTVDDFLGYANSGENNFSFMATGPAIVLYQLGSPAECKGVSHDYQVFTGIDLMRLHTIGEPYPVLTVAAPGPEGIPFFRSRFLDSSLMGRALCALDKGGAWGDRRFRALSYRSMRVRTAGRMGWKCVPVRRPTRFSFCFVDTACSNKCRSSRHSYQPDRMKRTELVSSVLTTLVWDGANYLQEKS